MNVANVKRFALMLTNTHDLRKPIARDYGFRIAKLITDELLVECMGESFYVSTGDDDVGRSLYVWRAVNASLVHTGELMAQRGYRMKDRVFLDVGAGIGTTSVRAITRFGCSRVVAFEHSHGPARLLRQNITLNGLEDKITPVLAMVSDTTRKMPSRASRSRPMQGSDYAAPHRRGRDIPTVALDDWLAENGIEVDAVGGVWIDVQGHEPDVLAGASRILASGTPVVCRFWPHRLREAKAFDQMWQFLTASDRQVTDLGPPQAINVSVLDAAHLPLLLRRYPSMNDFCDLLLLPV